MDRLECQAIAARANYFDFYFRVEFSRPLINALTGFADVRIRCQYLCRPNEIVTRERARLRGSWVRHDRQNC